MNKIYSSIQFKFLMLFIGVWLLSFSIFNIFTLEFKYGLPYVFLFIFASIFVFKIKDVDKRKLIFSSIVVFSSLFGAYSALLFVANMKAQEQSKDIINATSFYNSMELVMKKDCDLASSLLKQDLKFFLTTNPSLVSMISRDEAWKKAAINGCISGSELEQAKAVLNLPLANK